MDKAGQSATEDFEDVGHSADARKQLDKFQVGELPPSERSALSETTVSGSSGNFNVLAIPVLLVAIGVAYYYVNSE